MNHGDLIDMYLSHLRLLRRSPRTLTTYADILWLAHHALPRGLPLASDTEIIGWLGTPQWSDKTQSLRTTTLDMFFRWAVDARELSCHPIEGIPRPRLGRHLPRAATTEQVAAVLTRACEPVRTWATVAAYAGARCIEISRLHREHVTEAETLLDGKGGHERIVPTHPALWTVVRDLPPGPIADTNERRLSSRCWRAFRRVGVDTSMHRLRGWFAQTTLRATGDLAAVQDLLGHASPATTRIYASPSEAQMRAAVTSLPAVG